MIPFIFVKRISSILFISFILLLVLVCCTIILLLYCYQINHSKMCALKP